MLQRSSFSWMTSLASLVLLGVLHGCGGGGQTASNNSGVGSGGTGSYTNGPISGLGSIIVNGVRYEVSGSTTLVGDDKLTGQAPDQTDLLVGVTVEVEGSSVTSSTDGPGNATATRVRYAAELIGELANLSAASGRPTSFTVLGQNVTVNASTVLPTTQLVAGQAVVVHGLPTPGGGVTATRVDIAASPAFYKLSGEVQSISRLSTNRSITFRSSLGAGTVRVLYAQGQTPSPDVVAGSRLQVRVNISNNLSSLQAQQILVRQEAAPGGREVRMEGRLTGKTVVGTTVTGFVGRTPVDLSAIFGAQNIANNTLIEVKGRLRNGVLVVEELEEEDEQISREAELYGAPSNHNSSAQTFTLRGLTVNYANADVDGAVTFNEACLRVKGTLDSAALLRATRVQRSSGCR